MEEFVERAENQRHDFQALVMQSADTYTNVLYVPLAYYKRGLDTVRKAS